MRALIIFLLTPLLCLRAAEPFIEKQNLFQVGDDPAYKIYHIPGIVVTAKGTVLAWCEARKQGGDWDDIRVLLRRSTDVGKTWSAPKILAEVDNPKPKNPFSLRVKNVNPDIVPTEDIDTFWHYHILDTMKYAEDCEEYFGRFVHHFPYLGLRGAEDAKRLTEFFENTKALYEARFGECLIAHKADCQTGCGSVACKAGTCSAEKRPEYPHPSLVA